MNEVMSISVETSDESGAEGSSKMVAVWRTHFLTLFLPSAMSYQRSDSSLSGSTPSPTRYMLPSRIWAPLCLFRAADVSYLGKQQSMFGLWLAIALSAAYWVLALVMGLAV